MPRPAPAAILLAAALVAPTPARADGPPTSPIWNGFEAGPCDWPSVVQMEDSCSGTLVHPEVVIYAGHCGDSYSHVNFGEGNDNFAFSVNTSFCVARDGIGNGLDYAVCKLEEPVLDVPIVPILMGCEVDALQIGETATFVGFGEAEPPLDYGVKRIGSSTIQELANDEIFIQSDDGMDTCFGDSGGPVFIRLADGSWRVFGITSYGESSECGTGTWYSMMHTDLAWFEAQVGVDITPCHSADGEWDPTAACGGFPSEPGTGVGTWDRGCGSGPVGDMSATCGAAFGAEPDVTPPLAAVTAPDDGVEFMTVDKLPLTITGTATDAADKPNGWGIAEVQLVFNNAPIGGSERFIAPYEWDVKLPSGQYLIQVLAIDHSGNEGLSPPIAIGVNEPPPEIPEPDASSSSGGESSDTGDTPTDGGTPDDDDSGDSSETGDPLADGDKGGCGCRTPAPADAPLSLAVMTLAALRRRRRH